MISLSIFEILLIGLFVIGLLIGIIYGIYYYFTNISSSSTTTPIKTSTTTTPSTTTPSTTTTIPSITTTTPIKTSTTTTTPSTTTTIPSTTTASTSVTSTCPELSLLDYTFSTSSFLGKDLMTGNKEYFRRAAFTGVVLTNPNLTDPNRSYYIGNRKVSNTIKPAENGGEPCPAEFPQTIYKLI